MTAPSAPPQLMSVTVVHATACHFCDDARAALGELACRYPISVEIIDVDSPRARHLIEAHRPSMFPLVLVNGRFFSSGRLPRRKLVKLFERTTARVS